MATALWGIAALSTRHAIVEAENLSKHQKDKVDLEFCPILFLLCYIYNTFSRVK